MRSIQRFGFILAGFVSIILLAQVLAAPVTVTPTGDARGSLAAVSGTGNASAADDCSYVPVPVTLPGCVAGAAASGTGNATACASSYYGYVPCAGVATSVVGDASGCDDSHPSNGLTPNCIAAAGSVLGDSDACHTTDAAYTDVPGCIGVAASGTGDATACEDAEDSHWYFLWTACVGVAASATGDADACGNEKMVTLEDSRCIGVAVSGCDLHPTTCTDLHTFQAVALMNATAGPDADEDGFPAYVTLEAHRVTVNADTGEVTSERDPSQDVVVPVDPDDDDPADPVAQSVSVTVPTSVAHGPDADQDGLPSHAAVGFTRVTVHRTPPSIVTEPEGERRVNLDPNDQNENVPAPIRFSATFPSGAAPGPDADNDGVPAHVRIEFSRLTVDRRNLTTSVERAPDRDIVVRPDANDHDPNVPVRSIVTASFPSGVALGPDADGDGFPATTTVEFSRLTIDRRDLSHEIERTPQSDVVVRTDANDNDPNVPVRSVVSVSFPSGVALGPDADHDGVPATATIEFSRLTLDRRDLSHEVERTPQADLTLRPDPNDADPNVPAASLVSVPFPTGAQTGPDADGDGFPATATVTFSRLTVDRRDLSHGIAPSPADDLVVRPDPDDADPNTPVASVVSIAVPTNVVVGPDEDGDDIPAYVRIEFSKLTIDRRDGSHSLVRDPASDRTVPVDNNDHAKAQTAADLAIEDDAEASVLAVSLFGDAHATCGFAVCVAASGTGDAAACGDSLGCVAASGAGDASGYLAASGLGNATSCQLDFLCTAVSGAGNASGHDAAVSVLGDAESAYVAVSGAGSADGAVPLSASGPCNGQTCFSADGDGHWVGVAPGDASGIVAASAGGNATGGLVGASATGDAEGGLVAVSATGDAEGGLVAVSGTGDASGPIAVGLPG